MDRHQKKDLREETNESYLLISWNLIELYLNMILMCYIKKKKKRTDKKKLIKTTMMVACMHFFLLFSIYNRFGKDSDEKL